VTLVLSRDWVSRSKADGVAGKKERHDLPAAVVELTGQASPSGQHEEGRRAGSGRMQHLAGAIALRGVQRGV
jgi:hypothetical protein